MFWEILLTQFQPQNKIVIIIKWSKKLHLQINQKELATSKRWTKKKKKIKSIGCDLPLLTRLNINSTQTRNKTLDWNLFGICEPSPSFQHLIETPKDQKKKLKKKKKFLLPLPPKEKKSIRLGYWIRPMVSSYVSVDRSSSITTTAIGLAVPKSANGNKPRHPSSGLD